MKRWFRRILICLILGIVTTIGVAWAVAFLIYPEPSGPSAFYMYLSMYQQMHTYAGSSGSAIKYYTMEFDNFGTSTVHWTVFPPALNDASDLPYRSAGQEPPAWHDTAPSLGRLTVTIARGWPALALRCSFEGAPSAAKTGPKWTVTGGAMVGEQSATLLPTALPLRPIRTGAMINTLVYAATWFVPLFGVGMARRAIRRKRGRCPQCGYDLRGHVVGQVSELPGENAVPGDGSESRPTQRRLLCITTSGRALTPSHSSMGSGEWSAVRSVDGDEKPKSIAYSQDVARGARCGHYRLSFALTRRAF